MKRSLLPIALFLLLVSSLHLSAQDTATVGRVIDGTSFTTGDGRTIKLLGLVPPISRAVTGEECRQHLADLLAPGSQVILLRDSSIPDNGTILQRYVESVGESVNRRMLLDGYAAAADAPRSVKAEEFARAERSARIDKLGAWSNERATAVQCSGTTQKGARCQRTTTSLSGRCWQHEK